MRFFTQSETVMGTVIETRPESHSFVIQTRGGDPFEVFISSETNFRVLSNIDGLDRDRVPRPSNPADADPLSQELSRYLPDDGVSRLIVVQGVYQEYQDTSRFDASFVHLLQSHPSSNKEPVRYLFEESHWWLKQISILADQWLDQMFKERRDYTVEDFSELYRTNLNIIGEPVDDSIQEMATLSRLVYGLSSAYLLTGNHRYLEAARAGVEYQRESFRNLSHDGRYCFWAYGRRSKKGGSEFIMLSQNPDDLDTMPLYEQIYALAGLAQYYRITAEWEVLEDIRRTVRAFNDFYLDDPEHNPYFEKMRSPDVPGLKGYFSHLDFATMRPDAEALDRARAGARNRSRKNWNSVGDHIPAYLVNLVLALDPLPEGRDRELGDFREKCKWMLEEVSA